MVETVEVIILDPVDLSNAGQTNLFNDDVDTYVFCYHCNTRTYSALGGDTLCDECVKVYSECEHCEKLAVTEEMIEVRITNGYRNRTEMWCPDCLENDGFKCHSCSDHFNCTAEHRVWGDSYCQDCYFDTFRECARCGDTCVADEMHYVERLDEDVCHHCYPRYRRENTYVGRYHGSDRPALRFIGNGPLRFGMELECPTEEIADDSEAIHDALSDHCWMEEDGSVDGFEIISHPHSLEEIRRYAFRLSRTLSGTSVENDGDGCGIHIHVTRNAISRMAQLKMATFVNLPENKDFILKVARRNETTYWNLNPAQVGENFARGCHYNAVNFDNVETIEFRLFQSSTRVTNILGYIEFVACLIEWAELPETLELTPERFVAYVQGSTYDALKVFLTSVRAIAA